jgi:hypothetical protein
MWVAGALLVAGILAGGVLVANRARHRIDALMSRDPIRPHELTDLVQVWLVIDPTGKVQPFYSTVCECGWVGEAYDESDPQAQSKAFADARGHGSNVSPEVTRLG